MKIGVISDTHDNMVVIGKLVKKFNEIGVEYLFHCGDFCSPFTAREFGKLNENIKFHAVFGNNDGDHAHLNNTFSKLCKIEEHYKVVMVNDKKILMFHGHEIPRETIEIIANSGKYDLVLHGHFHEKRNEMFNGKTLLINPGEACGYLTGESTAAVIEFLPGNDYKVEFISP